MERADVIVIGLGAMGSATAYQLVRRGVHVLGIDRYAPPHDQGSSHGETRITRQAIGEGESYVPFALRAHDIWREIEAETGEHLLLTAGALILGGRDGAAAHHGKTDFVRRTINAAERFGIAHEVLDASEIAARYPQFGLRGDEVGCFEPGAGLVYPERCIAAQIALARKLGADIRTGEQVHRIEPTGGGVRVATDGGTYEADRIVVTAGAWTPGLIGEPLRRLTVHRQVLHWFEVRRPQDYAPERFPVFIWMHGGGHEDYFYGFPIPADAETPGVKTATERYAMPLDTPDAADRHVAPTEADDMYQVHVSGRLRGVGPACLRSAACFYTVTPDADFVIDRHPAHDRVILVSACSGHGFKHSPAVGEAIAELVSEGRSKTDLTAFALARLA